MVTARSNRRSATRRVQVVLPADVAASLQEMVPVRQRSAFVTKALEQSLMAASRKRAIDASFGAWTDRDYPLLNTPEDIEIWREAIWAGEDPDEALRKAYHSRTAALRPNAGTSARRQSASKRSRRT